MSSGITQSDGDAAVFREEVAAASLRGAHFVGTPEQVIEKIRFQREIFGHDRFLLQFTIGGIPHEGILRSIELLGREVAPAVREESAPLAQTREESSQ